MTDRALKQLAKAAGLLVDWTDAQGRPRTVSPESLRAVLGALAIPADNSGAIAESRSALNAQRSAASPTIIAVGGRKSSIHTTERRARIVYEDGTAEAIALDDGHFDHRTFSVPKRPGYHRLEYGNSSVALVVAPRRAFTVEDVASAKQLSGTAVQIYALRGGNTAGFGDFLALAEFAERVAIYGIDAIAISPVHAARQGTLPHYSPYSPSTRLFLNPIFAAPGGARKVAPAGKLIDWTAASEAKKRILKAAFQHYKERKDGEKDFADFVRGGKERLLTHARFEVLDERFRQAGIMRWRDWPEQYRDRHQIALDSLNRSNPAVEFQLFLQWVAAKDFRYAQMRARETGMRIGLIGDLAVGMDSDGSHAWSAPHDVLQGLSIGAPPDILGPDGQNWGLTALSPHAMSANGYDSFAATLRATMRYAGGVRIDHAMGLQRLWVIPHGASPADGAYLRFPLTDLLHIIALESWRNKAIVIGEDLGTVPAGFHSRLAHAGIMGMRVLWFEQNKKSAFLPPNAWERDACALTTTHDLPTVSGWWHGRDITWRKKAFPDYAEATARTQRARDRKQLWRALKAAKSVSGSEKDATRQTIVDGAIDYIAKTPSRLAIVPIEDIIGVSEQPNLPGTIDQHPNWRRRLPAGNGINLPRAKARLRRLAAREDLP